MTPNIIKATEESIVGDNYLRLPRLSPVSSVLNAKVEEEEPNDENRSEHSEHNGVSSLPKEVL